MVRCSPSPTNSCSVSWRDAGADNPTGRLVADVVRHPTGGLDEVCTGDDTGLALCLRDGITQVRALPNQPATLAIDENGKLYLPLRERTRKRFTPGLANITPNGADQVIFSDTSIELDNTAGTVPACYEVRLDIADAQINGPAPAPETVTIAEVTTAFPEETLTVAEDTFTHPVPEVDIDVEGTGIDTHDHGGDFTHAHDHGVGTWVHSHGGDKTHDHGGTLEVTQTESVAVMAFTIGDSGALRTFSADRFAAFYSGTIFHTVTVPAGVTQALTLQATIQQTANIVASYQATVGAVTATIEPVSCTEVC